MMKSGSESWQVTTNPNTELNFAVYLACAFGLRDEQPQGPMACWPALMVDEAWWQKKLQAIG